MANQLQLSREFPGQVPSSSSLDDSRTTVVSLYSELIRPYSASMLSEIALDCGGAAVTAPEVGEEDTTTDRSDRNLSEPMVRKEKVQTAFSKNVSYCVSQRRHNYHNLKLDCIFTHKKLTHLIALLVRRYFRLALAIRYHVCTLSVGGVNRFSSAMAKCKNGLSQACSTLAQ